MTNAYYPQPVCRTPVSRGSQLVLLLACVLLLGACASDGSRPDASHAFALQDAEYGEPTALSALSNEVLMRAIGLVGTPYVYGGNSQAGGFDCSGLVDFVFLDAAGVRLPRSTRELIALDAPRIERESLQPGDLVFFNPGGGRTNHIGIYVGEGRFVHAPSSGGTVRLDFLDSEYWRRAYRSAKRVLR